MGRNQAVIQNDINTLKAKRSRLMAELTDLVERNRDHPELPANDQERWDRLTRATDIIDGELAALNLEKDGKEAERAELLEGVRSGAFSTEGGDGAAGVDEHRRGAGFHVSRGRSRNPVDVSTFDLRTARGLSGADLADDLRGRAELVIERGFGNAPDSYRESAIAVLEAADEGVPNGVAEHILRTSNPHYVSAFKRWMANPATGLAGLTPEEGEAVRDVQGYSQRAAMAEGTNTAGGFMVPSMLDPTIVLTNDGSLDPFRAISTVRQISTQTWKGVTSAGVTAEWAAEAAEANDNSPTVAQPSITPVRAHAWVQASYELVQDSDISTELAEVFRDAKANLEATAHVTGTGSTQPKGIVTALQAVTASRVSATTNATFGYVDIFALDNALPARHSANASWLAHKAVFNMARQFASGSSPQNAAFWTDLGPGVPSTMLGHPVYITSGMTSALSTATASNDDIVVLGDFRKYYLIDRIGMMVAHEPLVKGANRRPTGEQGWYLFWRHGADVVDANAFRMLRA